MKLVDTLPLELRGEIEKEATRKFGLNACLFDPEGNRIGAATEWSNPLCPAIRATLDGQSQICARSHADLVARARRAGGPIVGECDAGFVKMVVPIFVDGEFLGIFGGCGRPKADEEIDAFYINKVTGLSE